MFGVIYLTLLPLLAYLSNNKDSIIALVIICLVVLSDLIVTDYLKLTLDNFFLCRAVVDLLLLVSIYKIPLQNIKKLIVSFLILISLSANVYLCFELGNVFIYRQWETINLILFELIILTLFVADRKFEYLKIKRRSLNDSSSQ